ncbi:hypothetical protein ATI61_108298 [Archangium gephyra]|uniref:Uncharacterized protein n=1 Tax=Archangium gephyra TaxID=48 RepID=A0AAC8Q773_9BACT|nr:hypothetical protein [Archangium gephyra]AKJ02313.1 Hypothetical protein AA314_03939 [Archangium gephyra]REG28757.1 hypothetical protein ATI61_108298 [Archangium gephyra]
MFSLTTSLALAAVLTLTQEEATRPESPPPASVSAPAEATAPAAESGKRELSRITLKDGQELHGVVVRQDSQVVVVELADGDRMELPARQVKDITTEHNAQVRDNGEIWFQDPNRTRYLYAPSGMMLRQGEGYFSQKELFFSSMNYGLSDNITVQAGAVVPAWLLGAGGFNFIAGVKVGGSVGDRLHLAAGAQGLFIPGIGTGIGGAVGFVFGTATYGTPDAHLSLGLGKPFTLTNSGGSLDSTLITTISGNLRVSQRVALVTENWLMPTIGITSGQLPMLNSLAVRLFGESWAVDLGGIRVPGLAIPIPWVDFAYNFG